MDLNKIISSLSRSGVLGGAAWKAYQGYQSSQIEAKQPALNDSATTADALHKNPGRENPSWEKVLE